MIAEFTTKHAHVRIVNTLYHGHVLYMDGEIQLSTQDEARYHRMLVEPILGRLPPNQRVLILGGGDGCAAREALRFTDTVTVVDYDREFVETVGKGIFANVNAHAFEKCRYVCQDALAYLRENTDFDVVLFDLPDPDTLDMQTLYFQCMDVAKGKAVGAHLGPASLNPALPHWDFLHKFKETYVYLVTQFKTSYIPSFSNVWAFGYFFPTLPFLPIVEPWADLEFGGSLKNLFG